MYYYYIVYKNNEPWYRMKTKSKIEGSETVREVTREQYDAFDAEKQERIRLIKKQLAETDYIACKIAEGAATKEEYAETLAMRAEWRAEINMLTGGIT